MTEWILAPKEPTREMCEAMPALPAIHAVDDLPLQKAGWSGTAIMNRKRYLAAIRQLAARPGVVEDDLTALLAEAKRKVDAMSPVEREAMYKAQRESWGRSCDGWDEGTVQVNAAAPSGSGDES